MKGCGGNCDSMPRATHTLTVQKPSTTPGTDGRVDLTDDANWVTVGRVRMRFITRGGRESHVYKQVQATTDTVLRGPSTTIAMELTRHPEWRLTFSERGYNRKLNIVAAYRINETGREVQIEAKERKQA